MTKPTKGSTPKVFCVCGRCPECGETDRIIAEMDAGPRWPLTHKEKLDLLDEWDFQNGMGWHR